MSTSLAMCGFHCMADTSLLGTGSQVCNLLWSKNVNEIVSTHGYSQNQIIVWKYPSMSKLATLTGHTLRVLYLAVSPDGQTIVTGAGVLPQKHIVTEHFTLMHAACHCNCMRGDASYSLIPFSVLKPF